MSREGYVYVLKSDHGWKVGKTRNLTSRMADYTIKLPFKVWLVAYKKTDDMHKLEVELHNSLIHKWINGEWFSLTMEDLLEGDNFKGFSIVKRELS